MGGTYCIVFYCMALYRLVLYCTVLYRIENVLKYFILYVLYGILLCCISSYLNCIVLYVMHCNLTNCSKKVCFINKIICNKLYCYKMQYCCINTIKLYIMCFYLPSYVCLQSLVQSYCRFIVHWLSINNKLIEEK